MSTVTLQMLIDYYLGEMRLKNRTSDSIKTNAATLASFARHFGQEAIAFKQVTEERVTEYVSGLQARTSKWDNHPTRPPVAKPLSPYTIRKVVKILRGFGSWLKREGFPNPFDVLDIPAVPKDFIDTLKPDEVNRLLGVLNPNTVHGARDHAMVLLMLDSGLRISEVAELRLPMVDLVNRQARVLGKGRKERYIPFGQTTARALMRYLSAFRPKPARPDVDRLFLTLDGHPMTRNSIECVIRRLRLSTGIKRLHAHLLRHTFAVNFLSAGGDVESLRRILGHESLEVTKRYLSGLQAEQVRALYEDYSPVDRLGLTDAARRFGRRGITHQTATTATPTTVEPALPRRRRVGWPTDPPQRVSTSAAALSCDEANN
jgi:site-specific recombinase XerD